MFLPGCSPLATTSDLLITNQLLYRLSHTSIFKEKSQTDNFLPLGERLGEKSVEQLYTTEPHQHISKEAQTNDYRPLGEKLGEKSVEQLYTTEPHRPEGLFPA